MSVNPINSTMITKTGRGARTEAQVREFNSKIRSGLSLYYKYIDMYSVLMKKGYGTNARYDGVDDGDDGLHYTTKTFKRIYYYCITYLNTGRINAKIAGRRTEKSRLPETFRQAGFFCPAARYFSVRQGNYSLHEP